MGTNAKIEVFFPRTLITNIQGSTSLNKAK